MIGLALAAVMSRLNSSRVQSCRPEISKGPSPGRLGSVQESQVPSTGFSGTGLMIPAEQKDARDIRERVRAQSNAVATHLDHIEEVAVGIQQPRDPEQGQGGAALDTVRADQLITAVRELRQVPHNLFISSASAGPSKNYAVLDAAPAKCT